MNKLFVDKKQIWNQDITYPRGLKTFFNQKPSVIFHQVNNATKSVKGWSPPIFLYSEYREMDNYVSGQLVYTGNGSTTTGHEYISSREILSFPRKIDIEYGQAYEPSEYLQTSDMRGKVLDAFCKIEFCIDAFICIAVDVYEEGADIKKIKNEFKVDLDGLFTSAHKKINYLRLNKLISEETYVFLTKAKKIRNTLAHQYLPNGDLGVDSVDISHYGDVFLAMDHIYNGAYFYLLKDYTPHELPILKWVKRNNLM